MGITTAPIGHILHELKDGGRDWKSKDDKHDDKHGRKDDDHDWKSKDGKHDDKHGRKDDDHGWKSKDGKHDDKHGRKDDDGRDPKGDCDDGKGDHAKDDCEADCDVHAALVCLPDVCAIVDYAIDSLSGGQSFDMGHFDVADGGSDSLGV